MRDVFVRSLMEEAERDPRIMLITGDLGFGVLDKFQQRFPKQFINAGVAEQNMTGLATGLALEGRVVFTYSIANFPILRCLEQIRNDAAYHDANVKVVSIGGGFSYGALGMSHHATEDLAILRALPQVSVFAPGCDWEVHHGTKALIAAPGTCYLRLDKSTAGDTGGANEAFKLGRARVVRRGARVAIVTCGGILGAVLAAADAVATHGLQPTVVSMHTLRPFDRDALLELAASHTAILTVEEHVRNGGLGSACAEVLLDAGASPRFRRLANPGDEYVSVVGSQDYLRAQCGLDPTAIATAIRELAVG
ncbi:MAG: transketolase C-terminal domain-containing protein [Gemmatimonadota bacterium]|nr:transketolase C-terminal domain-containing protein [Gemmatimonadota bacterium]